MARKLLNPELNNEVAQKAWNDCQYDIADIVLALTDNGNLEIGIKLYAFFTFEEFRKVVNFFTLDVKIIKKMLGINGNYTEHSGDCYSPTFNPKRNKSVLTLTSEEMGKRAEDIHNQLLKEMKDIVERTLKHQNGSIDN